MFDIHCDGDEAAASGSFLSPMVAGAEAGRPSLSSKCIRARAFSIAPRPRYFVKQSAGLSVPKTFNSSMSPVLTRSCTHRSLQLRCRILPRPRLLEIPIAAVASLWTRNLSGHLMSAANDCMPSPCAMPAAIPESSASPEDKAMVLWVLDQCLIWQVPSIPQPPLVLLLVFAHPAKSVSVNTSRCSQGLSGKS